MSQEIDRKWDWIVEHEKPLSDLAIPITDFIAKNWGGIASARDNRKVLNWWERHRHEPPLDRCAVITVMCIQLNETKRGETINEQWGRLHRSLLSNCSEGTEQSIVLNSARHARLEGIAHLPHWIAHRAAGHSRALQCSRKHVRDRGRSH